MSEAQTAWTVDTSQPHMTRVIAGTSRGRKPWVVLHHEADDPREHEANGRLMAASPELLAACEAAAWALSGEEYDPERFSRAADLVRAAIAKARGT